MIHVRRKKKKLLVLMKRLRSFKRMKQKLSIFFIRRLIRLEILLLQMFLYPKMRQTMQ